MRKQYYITYLIMLGLIAYSCKISQKSTAKEVSTVFTDANKYNLKGPIKQMRAFFGYTDSLNLSRDKQLYYNVINDSDASWRGFDSFDKNGLWTKMSTLSGHINSPIIDTIPPIKNDIYIYIYDLKDFKEKQQRTIKKKIPFPVYNPYVLKVNYRRYRPYDVMVEKDSLQYSTLWTWKYKFNSGGNVRQEKYYLITQPKNFDEEFDLEHRIENTYNAKNQLIRQDYYFLEFRKEFMRRLERRDFGNGDITFSVNDKIHHEFTYDGRDNIKTHSFFINNVLYHKETYTYNDIDVLTSLERYTISKRTYMPLDTDKTIEYFNEFGDLTKAVSYKNDNLNEVLRTKLYEYTYDKYNNWIRADMYLDGVKTAIPTKVANRIIEYYEE